MRFGIMEMQMDRLIPAEAGDGDAVDQILNFNRGSLVESLADNGFPLIELGGDLGLFFPTAYETKNIQRLLALKEERALAYTIHLPLWSVEPSTPLEPVRLGSVDAILDVIDAVEILQPEVYVLHATGSLAAEFYRMRLPQTAKSLALRQFQGGAINSIRTILEETGLPSRKLAIETIEFPLDLTLEIADLLDLSLCLDTGHVLAGFTGAINFEDALDLCLPRLGEVHLHDSPDYMRTGQLGYGKDHQTLGSGDLNAGRLIKRLEKRNFSGPVIFELSINSAQKSLAHLEEIGASA
jgi:sugar phosphate isomerase/epimerase